MLYTISFVFLFFFCDAGGYTCQAMFYCDYIHSPFLLNLLSHDLINLLALNLVMLLPQPPKISGFTNLLPGFHSPVWGSRGLLFWVFETRSHASWDGLDLFSTRGSPEPLILLPLSLQVLGLQECTTAPNVAKPGCNPS